MYCPVAGLTIDFLKRIPGQPPLATSVSDEDEDGSEDDGDGNEVKPENVQHSDGE
jgi:hypothetical protein